VFTTLTTAQLIIDIFLLVNTTNDKRKLRQKGKKTETPKKESYTEVNSYKNEISIGE